MMMIVSSHVRSLLDPMYQLLTSAASKVLDINGTSVQVMDCGTHKTYWTYDFNPILIHPDAPSPSLIIPAIIIKVKQPELWHSNIFNESTILNQLQTSLRQLQENDRNRIASSTSTQANNNDLVSSLMGSIGRLIVNNNQQPPQNQPSSYIQDLGIQQRRERSPQAQSTQVYLPSLGYWR